MGGSYIREMHKNQSDDSSASWLLPTSAHSESFCHSSDSRIHSLQRTNMPVHYRQDYTGAEGAETLWLHISADVLLRPGVTDKYTQWKEKTHTHTVHPLNHKQSRVKADKSAWLSFVCFMNCADLNGLLCVCLCACCSICALPPAHLHVPWYNCGLEAGKLCLSGAVLPQITQ